MTTSIANKGFQGKVMIIGGGVGGNALALFLHKINVPCVVYEAYAYKENVGGGLGMAPNGVNVMAALGLADKVRERGSVSYENVMYNARGQVLARFKNGTPEQYGQLGVSLMRPALYDILSEEINRLGIPVQYCKRLVSIMQTDTKVIAHFDDGTQDEGDLLIGCDGVRSQTRHIILPNGPEPEYINIVGVGGLVPAAKLPMLKPGDANRFHFSFGARGFFGYCGAEHGDIMWWANLGTTREYTREEIRNIDIETVRAELMSIFGHYHEPIPTIIKTMDYANKVNVYDLQSLPTWHKGRVLLMGDAAHAVSPNSGQGASMALEDAMYLARLLRDIPDYKRVFEQFEAHRKPRVERIVAEGRRRGSDKKIATPLEQWFRELMIRIFVNLFGEKDQEWMYAYKIDWNARETAPR